MPSNAFVRSIASLSLILPGLERCDRPSSAPLKASGVQPGRLAQGPDEKKGRAGRTAGIVPVMFIPFRMIAPRWGGVARDLCRDSLRRRQFRNIACDTMGIRMRTTLFAALAFLGALSLSPAGAATKIDDPVKFVTQVYATTVG